MNAKRSIVAALILVAALAAAGPVEATPQGEWHAVSFGEQSLTSQIGLDRTYGGGSLHVAWQRPTGPNSYDLLHTAIDPSGRVGPTTTIVADWVGVGGAALATRSIGVSPNFVHHVSVVFSGQRSTDTFDPFSSLMFTDSIDGGASWSAPSVITREANAYGRTPSAIIVSNNLFATWYDIGQTAALRWQPRDDQLGWISRSYPDGSTACCSYQQNIAADYQHTAGDRPKGGRLVVAWCSGVDAPNGLWAQFTDEDNGAPVAPAVRLPGSSTLVDGKETRVCDAAGRVPLDVIPYGGGFFVADSVGYPSATEVRLWRLGLSARGPYSEFETLAAGAAEVRTVALAASPDERLWVAWSRVGSDRLFFRRSNVAATVFGAVVSVRMPSGQLEASQLDIAPQRDRLDVLARFGSLTGVTLFHSQVYPGLTLIAKSVGHKATFHVFDAGDPIAGAAVHVAGRTLTTNVSGGVEVDLPRGTYRATASKVNYTDALARVTTK